MDREVQSPSVTHMEWRLGEGEDEGFGTDLENKIWSRIVGSENEDRVGGEVRAAILERTAMDTALKAREAVRVSGSGDEGRLQHRVKLTELKEQIESEAKADEPTEVVALAKLIEIRQTLVSPEMELSGEDLVQIEAFENFMRDNPQKAEDILNALMAFQQRMMKTLSVTGATMEAEKSHVSAVVDKVEGEKIKFQNVAKVLAMLHDGFKKIGKVDERGVALNQDITLLESHALISAWNGVEVVQAMCEYLTEQGVGGLTYPDGRTCGLAKLMGKAMTHEEGEYPEAASDEYGVDIQIKGVKVGVCLGFLPYLYHPRTDSADFSITKDGVPDGDVREVLQVLSTADKLVGEQLDSFMKYYLSYDERTMFVNNDIDGLIVDKLMSSFVYNLRNCPDIEMKRNFLRSDELRHSVLLLMLLRGEMAQGMGENKVKKDWRMLSGGDEELLYLIECYRSHHRYVREGKATGQPPSPKDKRDSEELLGRVIELTRGVSFEGRPELTDLVDKEIHHLFVDKYSSEQ